MKKKFVVHQEVIASLSRSDLNNAFGGTGGFTGATEFSQCFCVTVKNTCSTEGHLSACYYLSCEQPSCPLGNCGLSWEVDCVIDWEECPQGGSK